jgi:uncharacterized protein YjbI with pentapeptide repeats
MITDTDPYLIDRWLQSPWTEGVAVLIDPLCTKAQMDELIKKLYPKGDELVVIETFRGRGEFLDFRGVNLSGMNLRKVDFVGCDLSKGKFVEADLVGANFTVARLEDASFAGIVAAEQIVFIECFARGADFASVHLIDTYFWGAELVDTNFAASMLDRCDFNNARLQGAKFDGARMINCNVQGAHFSEKERHADWFKQSTFQHSELIVWVT